MFIKLQSLMEKKIILDDPSTIGRPNPSVTDEMTLTFKNDAKLNAKVKRILENLV